MTVAVVVGGGSGIGASVAARLRAQRTAVLVWDLDESADIRCDIADPGQVEAAVSATVERIGAPGLVTITAGIGHAGMLIDAPADDWDRVVGTNAKGVWLAMRALAGPMRDGGGGSIVATSSVSAHLADPSMGLYCASKAALDMVIRVAAVEWAPTVRVNGVAPGVTDTPMLGRAPRDGRWLTGVAGRTALGRLGSVHGEDRFGRGLSTVDRRDGAARGHSVPQRTRGSADHRGAAADQCSTLTSHCKIGDETPSTTPCTVRDGNQ